MYIKFYYFLDSKISLDLKNLDHPKLMTYLKKKVKFGLRVHFHMEIIFNSLD